MKPAAKEDSFQSTAGAGCFALMSFLRIQPRRPNVEAMVIIPMIVDPRSPLLRRDLIRGLSIIQARASGVGIMMNWNKTLFSDRVRRLK